MGSRGFNTSATLQQYVTSHGMLTPKLLILPKNARIENIHTMAGYKTGTEFREVQRFLRDHNLEPELAPLVMKITGSFITDNYRYEVHAYKLWDRSDIYEEKIKRIQPIEEVRHRKRGRR